MRLVDRRCKSKNVLRIAALAILAIIPTAASSQQQQIHPHPGVNHFNQPRLGPVFMHRPVYTPRPIFPVFVPQRFHLMGRPLFAFGLGLGFNPLWFRSCGPYAGWLWGYNCYAVPVYIGGDEGRQLAQLYFKDGSIYNVTDYWVVNGRLHFMTIDDSGTKWNEHSVDVNTLDMQKTADIAKQRGFRFVLRNEPMQQYLRDHPEIGQPGVARPEEAPASSQAPSAK
jgi:hypothetical protein